MAMINFKLIMVFVDEKRTERVLDAARAAGATGATIIKNARGQGLERKLTFFGLEYLALRDVILVLVEARRATAVMDAVVEAGELDESLDSGLALELDVTRALGLSEHVKALEDAKPPE
jgi:nitrogen regulatory protein PII